MIGIDDKDLEGIAPRDPLLEGGFDNESDWEKSPGKGLTGSNKPVIIPDQVVALQFKTGLSSYKRGDIIEVNASQFETFLQTQGAKKMATAKTVTAKTIIRDLIVKGKSDEFIIKQVHAKIADTKADSKHCTKYRRELFSEGAIGPELAALGSGDHRDWAKANLAEAKKGPHKAYWIQWEKDEKVKAKETAAAEKAKVSKKKATKKRSTKKSAKKTADPDLL